MDICLPFMKCFRELPNLVQAIERSSGDFEFFFPLFPRRLARVEPFPSSVDLCTKEFPPSFPPPPSTPFSEVVPPRQPSGRTVLSLPSLFLSVSKDFPRIPPSWLVARLLKTRLFKAKVKRLCILASEPPRLNKSSPMPLFFFPTSPA